MHSQLQMEVSHLRGIVSQYETNFKRIQAAAVCGAADEPEMFTLMEEVSKELAVIEEDAEEDPTAKVLLGLDEPGGDASLEPPAAPRQPRAPLEPPAMVSMSSLQTRFKAEGGPPRQPPHPGEPAPPPPPIDLSFAWKGASKTASSSAARIEVPDLPLSGRSDGSGVNMSTNDGNHSNGTYHPSDSTAAHHGTAGGRNRRQEGSIGSKRSINSNGSETQMEGASSIFAAFMRHSSVPAAELPVAKRLSKEAAQVLTPAGKRQLDKSKPRKKFRRSAGERQQGGLLTKLVVNPSFDLLCAFVIILNSALIGYEINWRTMSDSEPPNTGILNYLCTAFFFLELVLRMLVETPRGFFLLSENRNWNAFDFLLVAMSFVDILLTDVVTLEGDAGSVSQGLKTLKMLRIVRVCRVFRFFIELSQLAMMIVDSVKSLCWALIMLFIVIYVFAILFTHAASDHVRIVSGGPDARQDMIVQHFGSLGTTIYTLFHSMLNGISWYVLTDALMHLHPTMFVLYLFYIAFTMLAVLNIITGVFVDNAVEAARTQREFLVQKEIELKEKWCEEMRNLFLEMDEDGSGTVSLREVADFFKDERVWSYFQALGIEAHDAERLFSLLDEDGSGDISVDEFLSGCLRLKGSARSIDVYALIHDQRRLASRFCAIEEAVCGALNAPLPRGLLASKSAGTVKSIASMA